MNDISFGINSSTKERLTNAQMQNLPPHNLARPKKQAKANNSSSAKMRRNSLLQISFFSPVR